MDWNAIFFAVVLPFFIVGAIGRNPPIGAALRARN
jgi:hypothetical protein